MNHFPIQESIAFPIEKGDPPKKKRAGRKLVRTLQIEETMRIMIPGERSFIPLRRGDDGALLFKTLKLAKTRELGYVRQVLNGPVGKKCRHSFHAEIDYAKEGGATGVTIWCLNGR